MKKQSIRENRIAHIALALALLIGSFSLFSITFGLQLNNRLFYTTNQDKLVYNDAKQSESGTLSSLGELFSFNAEPENTVPARYILQKLEKLGNIRADSFLVGDLDTGEVIFERKPYTEYPIASVTKYMTAYTAAESFDPNEVAEITTSKLAVEGNRAGFKVGDSFTIRELLYPLLLVSSNDAAEIIAQQRDRDSFIRSMKIEVERIGMHDTHFEDPTGLSKGNTSTARDLFTMMRAVRDDYPQIIDISRLSFKENGNYVWTNINKASSFEEFRGGKTGYTNAARQTSIGYYQIKLANDQIKNIAVVILQSDTREQDTRNILEYLKRYVAYL
ncbi:D-alanyl-D-alanine carboxypeptidase [Patescibacteria group bacterium]|nr:D-alanyl-D-alanine carboxypeptidase [Patescibacteria group bacterium]